MPEFLAKNCKNFEGHNVSVIEEQKTIQVCTALYCVDRAACDGEIIEEIPDVHFEPK